MTCGTAFFSPCEENDSRGRCRGNFSPCMGKIFLYMGKIGTGEVRRNEDSEA